MGLAGQLFSFFSQVMLTPKGLLSSTRRPIFENMSEPIDETTPENWLLGAYVGTDDYHVILEISDHASLDVLKLAEEYTDADGNPDISRLFGSEVSTRAITPWTLRSNNKDTSEAVTEFFIDEVCLTEFIDYMKRNTNLRGKLYYENKFVEGSVIFHQFLPGMVEDRRIRCWKNAKRTDPSDPHGAE